MASRGQGYNDRFTVSYEDQQGDVRTALVGSTQWTIAQIRDTGLLIPWLSPTQDDFFQIIAQFSHRRKPLVNMSSVHIHTIPGGADTGDAHFSYSYYWGNAENAIPEIASWTTDTVTVAVAGADQYKHKLYDLITNITYPAGELYTDTSSIFLMKLSRLGTDDLDTYTGSLGILYLDLHFAADRIGSDDIKANK